MLTGADDELDCNEELKFHNRMKSTNIVPTRCWKLLK